MVTALAAPGSIAKPSGVKVLPYEPSYWHGVLALYTEVFGHEAADAFAARWTWSQSRNPCADMARQWVLVVDSNVIGFLATVPARYLIRGCEVIAHTPCDYAVHPAYRFHGLRLMRQFFLECENCVTCDDMPATIKVTRWLGAKPVAQMHKLVKPLDVRAATMTRKWHWLPEHALLPLVWTSRAYFSLAGLGHRPARIRPVTGFDSRFDAFFSRLAGVAPAIPRRDAAFLNWRYGPQSPHADAQVAISESDQGEINGYVVFRKPAGSRESLIFDLQSLPPSNEDLAGELLRYALDRLTREGAWLVRCCIQDSGSAPAFKPFLRCGFVRRGAYQFLVRFRSDCARDIALARDSWNYSFGDSEASHAAF